MHRRGWKTGLVAGLLLTGTAEVSRGQTPEGVPPLPGSYPCEPARPFHWKRGKMAARGSVLPYTVWPETAFGGSLTLTFQTQITNAAAARMVLHEYDFVCDSDALNYRGADRIRQIAALVTCNQFPVVVERSPQAPGLAEKRRLTVLRELVAAVGAFPPERVVVGPPVAVPLQGVEAELIYQNLLRLTESTGTTPSTGAGGISGGTFGGGTGIGTGVGGIGGTTGR